MEGRFYKPAYNLHAADEVQKNLKSTRTQYRGVATVGPGRAQARGGWTRARARIFAVSASRLACISPLNNFVWFRLVSLFCC